MANEFDVKDVQAWGKGRKGAGSVSGGAPVAPGAGAGAGDEEEDGEAAAGEGETPQQFAEAMRDLSAGIEERISALGEVKFIAADATKFRKRLDSLVADLQDISTEAGELADDFDEAHEDDEDAGEKKKPGAKDDGDDGDSDEDDEA